ncbi:MAG TPA: SdrD B-like domain-containing protein, partial [Methanothrix sp.]|nr:SdrD B-like domain-containing protein [Methanothrix sp.]
GSFSISGIVFRDINGDGAKNGLDAPVSAKTVQLFNTTGNLAIAQCTSGADGSYIFSNIAPGSYSIRAVATSGWQTTNSPITLTSLTGSVSNQDLGLKGTLAISGIKFQDKNGNGQRDTGEPPLSGWTIFNDSNQDGALQSGEISDVTDSQGIYNITNLIPGSNRIAEVSQSGWAKTMPAAGYHDVTLTNADVTGKDFGNIPSLTVTKATNPAGSTESFTFRDTVSSGDSFLLTDQQTKTFSAAPETYTVTEDAIAGWKLTNIAVAVSGTVSAKYGSGSSFVHDTFTAGDTGVQVALDANEFCILTFDNSKIYTISGLVWEDQDYDGLQDSGEPGLSGVSVELLDQNAGSFSPARTNSTNAEGEYSFTVTSGSYRVRFTPPSGRLFSPADQGGDDSLDSDAAPASGQTAVITLAAGASSSVQDAG